MELGSELSIRSMVKSSKNVQVSLDCQLVMAQSNLRGASTEESSRSGWSTAMSNAQPIVGSTVSS